MTESKRLQEFGIESQVIHVTAIYKPRGNQQELVGFLESSTPGWMYPEEKKEKGENMTEKVNWKETQGTPFIKGEDIGAGKEATCLVKDVRTAELSQSGKTVIVDLAIGKLEFALPLNRVNASRLKEKLGEDTTAWPGKKFVLYTMLTTNPQTKQEVLGVRVKV